MAIIAEALRHMLAAGMSHEAIVVAVQDMEAAMPTKRSNAEKQAEYRERNKSNCVTDVTTKVTNVTESNTPVPPNRFSDFPLTPLNPPKEKTASKKKPRHAKILLAEWERANGELQAQQFEDWAKKKEYSPPDLAIFLETFKQKCRAHAYKYYDFRDAFMSWDWKPPDKATNYNRMPSPAGG